MLGIDIVEKIFGYIAPRSADQKAKISAYGVAPGFVLITSISAVFGVGLAIDAERPVAVYELKTEIAGKGEASSKAKRGVVLIAEPETAVYRIPIAQSASPLWSSLDEEKARSNADSAVVNNNLLTLTTPFFGVDEPVTLVMDGELGKEIQVRGSTEPIENWRRPSRQSRSLVSNVLAICFLTLGMTLATATPSIDRHKDNASQI